MTTAATEPVQREKLDELKEVGGDEAFVVEIIDSYLGDARVRLKALHDAVAAGDTSSWTREAHTLKSASASVGAENLRALCLLLEHAGRSGQAPPAAALADVDVEFKRVEAFFEAWKAARA